MKQFACGIALLAISAAASAAEPVKSGPPVGERPWPYSFNVATGPERGQQFCYVCEVGKGPGVIVFARSLSEPLGKLLVELDSIISPDPDRGGVRGWATLLGEGFGLDQMSDWAKSKALRNTVVGAFDDPVGPPSYDLDDEADVTVLFFVGEKVVANFAFREGELDEKGRDAVLAAAPKLKP